MYEATLVMEHVRQAQATPLLSEREKHLVGLAVTLTRGCLACTRGRIEKARAASLGDEVLNAMVALVSAINAGVTAATAREAFQPQDPCDELCATATGASG